MNSSKNAIKGEKAKKKIQGKSNGFATSTRNIVLGCIVAVIVLGLIGGMVYDNFKPKKVFTINKEEVTLSDVMYYIYNTEMQGNQMDQLYQQFYGSGYWDEASQSDDTRTNRDVAKDEVVSTYTQMYALYHTALDKGYKINDEDKKTAETDVDALRKELSTSQKGLSGMSKKKLIKALEMKACSDRYKQDLIDSFDIDDEKITAGISKEENRQYDIQYYYIPITTMDENNESVKVSDDKLKAYEKELNELEEKAKTEDFDKLIPEAADAEKEEDDSSSEENKYTSQFMEEGKFVVGDGTFTTEVETLIKGMKNETVSNVIKGKDAYYLVKMINNNDPEAYENKVEEAISNEENTKFTEWYNGVKNDYKVEMNEKEWDKITIGKVIINK